MNFSGVAFPATADNTRLALTTLREIGRLYLRYL